MQISRAGANSASSIDSKLNTSEQIKSQDQKNNFSKNITKVGNSAVERKIASRQRQQQWQEFKDSKPQSGQELKEYRYQQFPGSYVLLTGKELHNSYNNGQHISDINTSKVMKKLIAEGFELQSSGKPAANSEEIKQLATVFSTAAEGKLSELTRAIALQVDNGHVSVKTTSDMSVDDWIAENDKPGNILILNGNNDETYVSLIGEMAKNTQHIHFITSGFGGHGTTDRHAISTNRTEGDRFKQILLNSGIQANRITVDPWSTNSGQNASNVAAILSDKITAGEPCNKIIISGTPAAVLRQTYTYAQQLDVPSLSQFEVRSFPFAKGDEYSTVADHLAILREFSTTINYLLNTHYLPSDATQYPPTFFQSAIDSFHKTANGLELQSAEKYESPISAMRALNNDSVTRIKENNASEEDKKNIKIVDDFFRSLFNPLELSFTRTSL